jgi:hypothetical protein
MWGRKKGARAEWETETPARAWQTHAWRDAWHSLRDPAALNGVENALVEEIKKRLGPQERWAFDEQLALVKALTRRRETGRAVSRFEGLGVKSEAKPFRDGYPANLLASATLAWEGGSAEARIELAFGRLSVLSFEARGADGQPWPSKDFDVERVQIYR